MDTAFLEKYYETTILPAYGDSVDLFNVRWKDHSKVGLDTWAHYFENKAGEEFVLLYEDFPGGEYLNDDLSHDIVPCNGETSVRATTTPETRIDNVVGYFTLYKEKVR